MAEEQKNQTIEKPKIDTSADVVNQFTPNQTSASSSVGTGQAGEKLLQPKVDTRADVVNQYTGEKWYYSDIVKEHFFNPRNLMLDEPDEKDYDAVGMVGSPACLLLSTHVRANPSLKDMDVVRRNERLLGSDGRYHAVERVFKVLYPKTSLVRLRNYLGEIIATKDHLIYAKQIPSASTFRHHEYKTEVPSAWAHAGELKRGDIALYPIPRAVKHIPYIPLEIKKSFWDFKSLAIPERVPVTPDFLELCGYFISEGHTKEEKEVGFTLSEKEGEVAMRIGGLVRSLFKVDAHIRHRPRQHRIDIVVYNVHLARNFRTMFGDAAPHKHIPEAFMLLAPKLQQSLLKGLWIGDGYFAAHRAQPRAGFATVSRELFHQVSFLLLRQHIVPSTFTEPAKKIRGVSHLPSYRIHVGDMASLERLAFLLGISFRRDPKKRHETRVWIEHGYVHLPIKKAESVPFSGGRLYNFEVAKNHTYATDAFLVHNCGDMMKMWLKVEPETEKVQEMKWRTFGCGSAIAATSMFSVMVTENGGLPIADALKIRPQDIMLRLGGLPNRKIHCSVLADKAFRKAANEYFRNTGQNQRIIVEGARVIDAKLNITDKDIEEAVLEGAVDLDSVQRKLKVGIGSPEIITEVEQLIRFYKEKYYG